MAGDRTERVWLSIPRSIRRLPADLGAVLVVVGAINVAVFVPIINRTPLRVVAGIPFVLFIPGYALIAALFPEAGESPIEAAKTGEEGHDDAPSPMIPGIGALRRRGIDGIERVALSFGLSIAIVPLIGLALNFTPFGIRLVPVMVATSVFTVGTTWVAARRRQALAPEHRFSVPYQAWIQRARSELFDPETRVDAALNVLLVLSVLLAITSVAYAVTVPRPGESFTEFYLLTENESGDLVADNYPTEFVSGEGQELVLGIENHEHQSENYTVVVELQRVTFETNGSVSTPAGTERPENVSSLRVTEEEELRRFQTELDHNRTWRQPYSVRPTLEGRNLRLAFLLYRGSPPPAPAIDNAYRETHLWINVTQQ